MMKNFDRAVKVPEVVYNRKFAVRDLTGAISGLLQLSTLRANENFSKAVERTAEELLEAISPMGRSAAGNKKTE